MRINAFSVLAIILLFLANDPALAATAEKTTGEKTQDGRVVKDGMMVTLEFTLKNAEGKVLESSKGGQPLKYIHGQKMMIPGLERELTGMKIGGEKHVTVKPQDGFGKINPKAVQEVPKEKIPPNALKVGAVLATRNPEGTVVPMTVREIKEKTVVMDMNHPMAGKTLVFDIKVVDIQPAPPPPQAQPAAPAKPVAPAAPAKPAEPAKK